MVSLYIAHAQNSFYTVVIYITFGLLAVSAFLYSNELPIADRIRGETVIMVKDGDPLSRFYA